MTNLYRRSDLREQTIKDLSKVKANVIKKIQDKVKGIDGDIQDDNLKELKTLNIIEDEVHMMHADMNAEPSTS